MISATSDYALRAVLVLAGTPDGRPLHAHSIAAATGAPRNYMGKTLNALVKRGVLRSSRGPLGGFSLALPPEAITVARIIECFNEPAIHSRCLLGNRPCNPSNPCVAHHRWSEIGRVRSEPLRQTTIAELIGASTNKE